MKHDSDPAVGPCVSINQPVLELSRRGYSIQLVLKLMARFLLSFARSKDNQSLTLPARISSFASIAHAAMT
jgi:hypothetical protein